ncbi:MAG: Na-K-Cl cotransporter [Actinobacteria bacterium]|nr:Na-K-Cl cotransporter [Actinomycetota bacterium]
MTDRADHANRTGFGTFEGVFIPTLLTILGVIMYLREGWTVGNAGLGGALLIILLAFAITGATGLSMSSVTTNIRIGAGGAYSIISRSLGLEVGGSIGIPLFLSQTLAVVMYVFGFREGWQSVFPDHPALLVDVAVFAVILGVGYISAGFAFRIQFLIVALILGSLVSVAVAAFQGSMTEPIQWWGSYPGGAAEGPVDFWIVFAVFFPAATGIMAGANLSGELENPRKAIPVGTLSAIGVSLVIYLALAFWLAKSATVDELVNNFNVMIDKSAWGPAVVAGLLGATFSSGLSSLIGAPRILSALGDTGILPRGRWVAKKAPNGEPRRALLMTGAIALAALMLRDLNAVAPLITMFFLITYAMINVVVLVEQRLGLVSFRPLLKVPQLVPLLGAAGCVFAMFIVNPAFSLIGVAIVFVFYSFLIRRHLVAEQGDVRSGLFVALAEWAARRVSRLDSSRERGWKPNLLVPVSDIGELRGTFRLLRALAYPRGSLKILGFSTDTTDEDTITRLERVTDSFREEEIYSSWAFVPDNDLGAAFVTGMATLKTAFFQPNIVFLATPLDDAARWAHAEMIVASAPGQGLGVLLYAEHPTVKLGRQKSINLWFPIEQIGSADLVREIGDMDLATLVGFKLVRNWDAEIRILTALPSPDEKPQTQEFLAEVIDLARLPSAIPYVLDGDLESAPPRAPQADLSIFLLPESLDPEEIRARVSTTRSSCLFAADAGFESALA